jgi:predicted esterase
LTAPTARSVAIESEVLEARTRGRFLLRPPLAGTPRLLLVGCHGYGENAARHLAQLERIAGAESWALVAVDALNAFYERRTNDVIRGWMTRELREEAIEDNLVYLRAILDRVRPRFGWRVPVVYLGFSQGAAMAWRAAVRGGHGGSAVVALGGDLPPELVALPADHPFPPRVLLLRGERDEWYTAEKLAADRAALAGRQVAVEELLYPGGHEWTDAVRARIAALLAEISLSI